MSLQAICYFLLTTLLLCNAQLHYWQPVQNITDNLYNNIVPDMTSAQHNGTQVIIWAHAATLRQAVSLDNGTTWNTRMLTVSNAPISLFGAFTNPTLKYVKGEWILIFTSTDIPWRSLTVSAKASTMPGAWNYVDHQARDFDARSWDEVTAIDNSVTLNSDGLWLASWLSNNTLKVQTNWTTIINCAKNVFSQELIADGQVLYQTSNGIYRVNASECASPELITSLSSDFFVVEADSSYMLILKTGEIFYSVDALQWSQRMGIAANAFTAKFLGNTTWIALAQNYTCLTYDNALNWQCQEDNTPEGGVLFKQPELSLIWMQVPYLQKAIRKVRSIPIIQVNLTTVVLVERNQTIEGDLQMDGVLILQNETLKINGNLRLNRNSTLTVREGTIEVAGNLTANGQLNITAVKANTTIITFNEYEGNFTEVQKLPCQSLQYARHALTVAFDTSCEEDALQGELAELQIWQIATIAGGSSLAVMGAVISLTVFRKRIFPYRDREYNED